MITHILLGFLAIPSLIGLFVLFHLFRDNKKPADKSNRINKIRLFWFVMTRENLFVDLKTPEGDDAFEWLKYDEYYNIKKSSRGSKASRKKDIQWIK